MEPLAGTTVNGGGSLFVGGAGSTVINTTINWGGTLDIQQATATNTTINAGGLELVSSATINGTAINGGTLQLQAGALSTGNVDFIGSNGTLQFDDAVVPNFTINGFDTSDRILLGAIIMTASNFV